MAQKDSKSCKNDLEKKTKDAKMTKKYVKNNREERRKI